MGHYFLGIRYKYLYAKFVYIICSLSQFKVADELFRLVNEPIQILVPGWIWIRSISSRTQNSKLQKKVLLSDRLVGWNMYGYEVLKYASIF